MVSGGNHELFYVALYISFPDGLISLLILLHRSSLPIVQQRRGDLYQLVDVQRLKAESH